MVLSGYSGFFHHKNWSPRYNSNIVERGVKTPTINQSILLTLPLWDGHLRPHLSSLSSPGPTPHPLRGRPSSKNSLPQCGIVGCCPCEYGHLTCRSEFCWNKKEDNANIMGTAIKRYARDMLWNGIFLRIMCNNFTLMCNIFTLCATWLWKVLVKYVLLSDETLFMLLMCDTCK